MIQQFDKLVIPSSGVVLNELQVGKIRALGGREVEGLGFCYPPHKSTEVHMLLDELISDHQGDDAWLLRAEIYVIITSSVTLAQDDQITLTEYGGVKLATWGSWAFPGHMRKEVDLWARGFRRRWVSKYGLGAHQDVDGSADCVDDGFTEVSSMSGDEGNGDWSGACHDDGGSSSVGGDGDGGGSTVAGDEHVCASSVAYHNDGASSSMSGDEGDGASNMAGDEGDDDWSGACHNDGGSSSGGDGGGSIVAGHEDGDWSGACHDDGGASKMAGEQGDGDSSVACQEDGNDSSLEDDGDGGGSTMVGDEGDGSSSVACYEDGNASSLKDGVEEDGGDSGVVGQEEGGDMSPASGQTIRGGVRSQAKKARLDMDGRPAPLPRLHVDITIPCEVFWARILPELDQEDLLALAQVHKAWRKFINSSEVWTRVDRLEVTYNKTMTSVSRRGRRRHMSTGVLRTSYQLGTRIARILRQPRFSGVHAVKITTALGIGSDSVPSVLEALVESHPHVTSLYLGGIGCPGYTSEMWSGAGVGASIESLQHLRELMVPAHAFHGSHFANVLRRSKVSTLHITEYLPGGVEAIAKQNRCFPSVRLLSLTDFGSLSARELNIIARTCPNLEYLHLLYGSGVKSDSSLQSFLAAETAAGRRLQVSRRYVDAGLQMFDVSTGSVMSSVWCSTFDEDYDAFDLHENPSWGTWGA